METYVCADLDETTLDCLQWVQTTSLPALSVSDGLSLAATILVCWVVAFGFRAVGAFLYPQIWGK
jgi:hypothetical protein